MSRRSLRRAAAMIPPLLLLGAAAEARAQLVAPPTAADSAAAFAVPRFVPDSSPEGRRRRCGWHTREGVEVTAVPADSTLAGAQRDEVRAYLARLERALDEIMPEGGPLQPMHQAVVRTTLAADGTTGDIGVVVPSASLAYDSAAARAVKLALIVGPEGPPPAPLARAALTFGIGRSASYANAPLLTRYHDCPAWPARQRPVVQPEYPESLRKAGVEGTVMVQFVLDSQGRPDPRSFRVLRSPHPLFTASVLTVLPRLRYLPRRRDGRDSRALVQQPFTFRLEE